MNQIYLSVSIPLDGTVGKSVRYFGYYNDKDRKYKNSVTYNHQFGDNYVSVGATDDFHDDKSVNASIYRDTSYGTFELSGTTAKDYNSISASADGSVTITPYGPVMQKRVYQDQARMILDTGDASGVSINDGQATTNRFGLAGISNIPSYYRTYQYIDMNTLPNDVSVDDNVVESTLTTGAIGYQKLESLVGNKGFAVIKSDTGEIPPFGSIVLDEESKKEVGMITEDGYAYLTGVQAGRALIVKWGDKNMCRINITSSFDESFENLTCHME